MNDLSTRWPTQALSINSDLALTITAWNPFTVGSGVSLTGDITNGVRSMCLYNNEVYGIDITGSSGAGRLIKINPTTGACTVVGSDGNPTATWYGLATI